MSAKQATFIINGEKVRVNDGVLTGPEHLLEIIHRENERLKGSKSAYVGSIFHPPGDLRDMRSLCPLLWSIFGNENVIWDQSEPTIYYKDLHPGRVY
jgi:hypothetical protein